MKLLRFTFKPKNQKSDGPTRKKLYNQESNYIHLLRQQNYNAHGTPIWEIHHRNSKNRVYGV